MTDLTTKQKKEWAGVLYLKENMTQAEIAEKVGVSRITINKWVKAEKWEEHKTGITLTREWQISNLYRQVEELNKTINSRPKGLRYASSQEADTIVKISGAIKKMETECGISDIISVFCNFLEWLRAIDLEKTKEISRLYDAYIKDKL